MGLAVVHPAKNAGLMAPTGRPVGALLFRGVTVRTLTLAGEDLVRLAEALSALGFWPVEVGLAWLVQEGVRHYVVDQRAWKELASTREEDPARLELQRREALAHLLSMRARTLAAEVERDALRQQVAELSEEYARLKRSLLAARATHSLAAAEKGEQR